MHYGQAALRGILQQRHIFWLVGLCFFIALPLARADVIKLQATADIWLSAFNERERNSSSGKVERLKLKSIQEMAAIRFAPRPIMGREVLSARLFLHTTQTNNQLRYIRISTVNQDWVEGNSRRSYGTGNGATYNYADHAGRKPWAWPGSQFCDVTFSSGQSLSCWAERREEGSGWISVDVDPRIVIAMVAGDTDGMAVMDGGTYKPFNNFIHSRESGRHAPYLLVEVGPPIRVVPEPPTVSTGPDPDHADLQSGAVRLWIRNDPAVFCWRVKVNGRDLDRWQVPHPLKGTWTAFSIPGLAPSSPAEIEVTAVSLSGHASPPAKASTKASPGLSAKVELGRLHPPRHNSEPAFSHRLMRVWALPPLVKLSPLHPESLHPDMARGASSPEANSVWDGRQVLLFGIRGEYVDFQLCVESLQNGLQGIRISPDPLRGPHGAVVEPGEIELYKNWYAKTRQGIWQPAYTVPVSATERFAIPDPKRGIRNQQNQTFSIDVYIPKDAAVGTYIGKIAVSAHGVPDIDLPVQLEVHAARMPDELAFWPEMNAYSIPTHVQDYYRLAHQHRCVANFWAFRPKVRGQGDQMQVLWKEYDELAGPLLSGEAFDKNRRAGHPIECMYLPYKDSWPTPLSREAYHYDGHWPGKGESQKHLIEHYLKSPYIGDALCQNYKAGFLSVQRQFIEHFREKGWDKTELQCFFGGKKTHRINYGSNMWWTTDEPYHWGDWLALQFFTGLWADGREQLGALETRWAARADISRPQWQGNVLEGRVNSVYYGGFIDERTYRRCRILREETGIRVRAYGSAGAHDRSNTETVALVLNTWLNGADGFLSWWTIGKRGSLDVQEGCAGNALFVPGDRFGLPVVGDMRLKAFRKGEQLVEYLVLLSAKHDLNRQQLKHMVVRALDLQAKRKAGASADNADALRFGLLKAWQIEGLRAEILKILEK
jgi:hypothetical protein